MISSANSFNRFNRCIGCRGGTFFSSFWAVATAMMTADESFIFSLLYLTLIEVLMKTRLGSSIIKGEIAVIGAKEELHSTPPPPTPASLGKITQTLTLAV